MVRKRLVRAAFAVALCALAGIAVAFWMARKSEPKPNVLLITLDTTRADHLGCYGHASALTPTLDGLAQRGILFERAYTPVPMTLPAHASIHTGLYPFKHGLYTNGRAKLSDGIPTLAEMLSKKGYATAAFVASFVLDSRFGLNRGFTAYDDKLGSGNEDGHGLPKRTGNRIVDVALPWISSQAANPFFCWMHFYDAHIEYQPHEDLFGDRFRDHPYDAELAFVDLQLARLFKFLEDKNLTNRTIVVVVGDHGEGLGEHLERLHGDMLYNSTLRVPLIVSYPTRFESGTRISAPISLVDLCPTILDCLGVEDKTSFNGRSLKPALLGQSIDPDLCYGASDELYLQEGWSPLRCLVKSDWKYIHTAKPELYDLEHDPGEEHNLSEAEPARAREMHQILSDMEAEGVRHSVQTVFLSPRERNILESLGYAGGQSAAATDQPEDSLPDIKDMRRYLYDYQAAQELYAKGNREEAIVRLRKLAEEAPHYLAPRLVLGRDLETKENFAAAQKEFEDILKTDPNCKEANARVGKLLAMKGHYREALPYLRQSLEHNAKGDYSDVATQALPYLQKALRSDPNGIELNYVIGEILRAMGRGSEAMAYLRRAEMEIKKHPGKRAVSN